MKIATIVGARPQFIKMAPVSKKLRKHFDLIVVHTGQHYDYEMSGIFFEQLNIPEPDYYLGVGSGTHGYQTGEMLKKIEKVLIKEKPKLILVYGDTNSTLAGALAAVKLHIKVAHVEAGLRSFDKEMPEEINRVLTDHVSDYLFAPTKTAVKNLRNEGIRSGVYLTGDVMYDALLDSIKIARKNSKVLDRLGLKPKEYLLATVHRAENTDNQKNLENIIKAFIESDELIVFPAHPRTQKYLKAYGLVKKIKNASNIILIPPMSYLDMLILEANAKKILTDSGGVQKEAYFLKVPCITLRERTEWVETVEDGWNVLVGADKEKIINEYERAVVLRLGKFLAVKGPGLIILIPIIDKMRKLDLRTVTLDVPPQEVITKDNVSIRVSAVVYFRVIDPEKAFLQVEDYHYATSQLAQTTLRSVCGQAELDEILAEREKLNIKLQEILDADTEPWGVKVSKVEIKEIDLPEEMKRAMAKQAEAERERRAKIINAEGELQASKTLLEAAQVMAQNPITLQLRYLQTLTEISTEKNSTIIFPLPLEILKAISASHK